MAAELTERQAQIRDLQRQGLKPKQIGEQLGISDNAVHQQLRRMRDQGKLGGGSGSGSKKSGRQSGAKSTKSTSGNTNVTGTAIQATVGTIRAITPLQAIRNRRDELTGEIKEAEKAHAEAQKVCDRAKADLEKVQGRHADELAVLDATEAVLKGEKVAAKKPQPKQPKPEGAANGKPGDGEKTSGEAEKPAAPATTGA